MKRTFIAASLLAALSAPAYASCVGTDTFSTCLDGGGNTYNIHRYGNNTHVDGYGANGSHWSQDSSTIGNTTYHNGHSADGDSWSGTSTTIGGSTFNSGTDSDGNFYNSTCTAYGCY